MKLMFKKKAMKEITKNRIRHLVTFNRITKFVAKIFGMISNFKDGEYVQLKFDKSRKFYVVSNVIIEGKIKLGYFNTDKGIIEEDVYMEPSKLEYSIEEMFRRYEDFKNRPDLESHI